MSKAAELAALIGSQSALSNRNLIINGAMQVAQRGTSATVSDNSNEGYSTLDRWFLNFNAGPGGALDFSQSTDAPDGFANSIKLACSTADATHTGTENIHLVQYIEAQNLQQLAYGSSNSKSITVSWYMKAVNFSGPITLAFETVDGTAEYYAVSKTPTSSWARYSATIPGSSSATINNDNGVGLRVKFVLAGTSSGTYAASSDSTAWSTTRADYRDDIGNLVSSTSNEFYITGVQLEVGETATPFEHEPYGVTLQKAQRYYFKFLEGSSKEIGVGWYYNNTHVSFMFRYPTTMRATPTATDTTGTNYYIVYRNNTSDAFNSVSFENGSTEQFSAYNNTDISGTAGQAGIVRSNNASAKIEFDAEL